MTILSTTLAAIIAAPIIAVAILSLAGISIRDLLYPTEPLHIPTRGFVRRAHPTDAGGDIAIQEPVILRPGERRLAETGLKVAIPTGMHGQVVPRSSLPHKLGVTVANSPGIIDSDYRGTIKVNLINHSNQRVELPRGTRVAQLLIIRHETPVFDRSLEFDSTERGEGGHGSTGGVA